MASGRDLDKSLPPRSIYPRIRTICRVSLDMFHSNCFISKYAVPCTYVLPRILGSLEVSMFFYVVSCVFLVHLCVLVSFFKGFLHDNEVLFFCFSCTLFTSACWCHFFSLPFGVLSRQFPYCAQGNLRQWLQARPRQPWELQEAFRQVMYTLKYDAR